MTKKQVYAAKQEAWKQALREGRVVRYFGGERLVSYPTLMEAVEAAEKFGEGAERVADYS